MRLPLGTVKDLCKDPIKTNEEKKNKQNMENIYQEKNRCFEQLENILIF